MGFFDKLKGIATSVANVAVKADNKDLMQAMVASAVVVAYADGDLSDEEMATCSKILKTSSQLTAFGDTPAKLFDTYCTKYEASGRMARVDLLKEIADVKDNEEEAIRVLVMGIEVADADNDIDDLEMKMLNKIADTLGLNLSDFL